VETDPATLVGLLAGARELGDATATGDARVTGDTAAFRRVLAGMAMS
jgi:hypothetical protein